MSQPPNTPLNADDELRRDIALLFNRQSNANAKSRSETISDAMDIVLADRKKHELQARYNELLHVYDSNGLYFYDDKEDGVTVGQRIAELKQELESYE